MTSFDVSSVLRSAFSVWSRVVSAVTVTASDTVPTSSLRSWRMGLPALTRTPVFFSSRKPDRRDVEVVGAGLQVAEGVVAVAVRLGVDLQARARVGHGHGGAGNGGAGLIADGSDDGSVQRLCGRGRRGDGGCDQYDRRHHRCLPRKANEAHWRSPFKPRGRASECAFTPDWRRRGGRIRHENREVDTRVHGAGWTRIPTSRWVVGAAARASAVQGFLNSRLARRYACAPAMSTGAASWNAAQVCYIRGSGTGHRGSSMRRGLMVVGLVFVTSAPWAARGAEGIAIAGGSMPRSRTSSP